MVSHICKLFLSSIVLCAFTACGGDPTITETVVVYAPVQHARLEMAAPGRQQQAPAPVLLSSATESERQAEALRMVELEQAQSIEFNRRHTEQLEREARISANAKAGVVQSPGCEDTVGHAAVVCEQSVVRL